VHSNGMIYFGLTHARKSVRKTKNSKSLTIFKISAKLKIKWLYLLAIEKWTKIQ
jgi:hypothetical protein